MSSEHEPDDRELEDFLSGKSALSSAYRDASRETAPPELDAPILAAARAAAAQPRAARRPRWLRPLAFAATFVLSLGVLLSIYREPALRKAVVPGEDLDEMPASASEAAPESAPAASGVATPSAVLSDAPAEYKVQAEFAKQKREETLEREKASHERVQAEPAKPEPPSRADEMGRLGASPPPAAMAPPPPPTPVELDATAPKAAATASESGGAMSRDTIENEARQAPAAPAAGAAAQKKSYGVLQSSAPVVHDDREFQPADNRAEPMSVDQWWQRIRDLRDRGDLVDARREFGELRKAYPDAEVPADLRGLVSENR